MTQCLMSVNYIDFDEKTCVIIICLAWSSALQIWPFKVCYCQSVRMEFTGSRDLLSKKNSTCDSGLLT